MLNKFETFGDVTFIYAEDADGYERKVMIDTDDIPKVENLRWRVARSGIKKWQKEYVMSGTKFMHRIIKDPPKRLMVDHINHNTLDNRKCNLRTCTNAQNQQNRAGANKSNKTSGIRGVHWESKAKKWRAAIQINKRVKTLGRFHSIEEAEKCVREYRAKNMPFSEDAM